MGIGTPNPAGQFYVSGATFAVTSNNGAGGYVGIGISTPAATLDVSGNAQFGGGTTKSTFSASGYLTFSNISQPTAAPGRIYYDSSLNDLVFSTAANSGAWVAISTNSSGGVPAGTVAYFNLTACPSGWTELSSAEGRYLVGLHAADPSSLGTAVGTALSDQENRPVGQHSHGITDPGHQHQLLYGALVSNGSYSALTSGGGPTFGSVDTYTQNAYTGITISTTGSVAGTNAPYMELLICQCTGPGVCQSGGSASSANGLSGGAANEIPYQTAPSNTSFTSAPGANSVLFANSGAPTWTNTPTLTGTNFTGVPDGALSSNVTLLNGVQAITGAKTFSNTSLTLTGSGGTIVGGSSITAGAFFGYGGNLTGVSAGSLIGLTSNQILYGNAAGGIAQVSTFTLTGAGNVGIGTTSPAATLDVSGNAQFGGGTTKSTFSASGYLTLANIFQPTAAPGAIYYNATYNTLMLSTGTNAGSWVVLAPRGVYLGLTSSSYTGNLGGPNGAANLAGSINYPDSHMCYADELNTLLPVGGATGTATAGWVFDESIEQICNANAQVGVGGFTGCSDGYNYDCSGWNSATSSGYGETLASGGVYSTLVKCNVSHQIQCCR